MSLQFITPLNLIRKLDSLQERRLKDIIMLLSTNLHKLQNAQIKPSEPCLVLAKVAVLSSIEKTKKRFIKLKISHTHISEFDWKFIQKNITQLLTNSQKILNH